MVANNYPVASILKYRPQERAQVSVAYQQDIHRFPSDQSMTEAATREPTQHRVYFIPYNKPKSSRRSVGP
jgi:hypothetical protein